MYASFQIPKPTDEQVLERAPLELFRCVLNDPNVSTHGRRGQAQQGVDIYGKRDGNPSRYVGIQCKLKSNDKALTEDIVRDEVNKALAFEPRLTEYFIITTAPDDAGLQKFARVLEAENQKKHGRTMSIQIWGWNTMEREIQRYPSALREFFPDFTPFTQGIAEGIQEVSTSQREVLGRLDTLEAGLTTRGGALLGAGDVPAGDPLERHLDGEIDTFREFLKKRQPGTALNLFKDLQGRLGVEASDRIQFRIKANMAFCLLELGDEDAGLDLLLEACAHTPDAPKAIAHQALVALLKGNWKHVLEIGERGLEVDPTNEELAGYYVQGLKFDPEVTDPLVHLPITLRTTRQVEVAHLYFLRQREATPDWWDKAEKLREKYPDERYVAQAFAESALDRVLKEENAQSRYQIPEDRRRELEAAHTELLRLWNELDFTQAAPQTQDLGLFTNLILSCDLLGKVAVAKKLTVSCPASILEDNDVSVRIAQLAFNHDERELFGKAVEKISDDSARFHFEFYGALVRRDWPGILSLTDTGISISQNHEKELVRVAREIAKLLVFDGEVAASQVLEVEKLVVQDLRGHVLIYDTLLLEGFEEEASEYYDKALTAVLDDNQHAARAMLAQRAAKRNDWHGVNRLLVDIVDVRQDNDLLGLLASSYASISPPTKSAVSFFKNLPTEISQTPYYLERAAVFHFNRGALGQSEECYRAAIAASDRPELGFYMPLLSLLQRRQKHGDIEALIGKMLNLELHGNSEEQIWYAHFLMKHGHPERAISVAYSALQLEPENPEPHSGYCGLILMNTRLGPNERVVPSVPEVAVDCWVEIEKDDGERRQFLISDDPKSEAQHLFQMIVGRSHDLAQHCLRGTIGTTFQHGNGFGRQVASWRIVDVKHKYAQACHVIMDEFDVRFPNSRLMAKMTMVNDDVEPILQHIRDHSEHHKKNSEFYTKQGFPIAVLAAIQGGTSIEYAGYLRSLGYTIQVCRGFENERQAALELISNRRLEGVTIDALTAWTIHWSNSFDTVKRVFGTIRISQSCLDEITIMTVEAQNKTEGRFGISWKDGQFYKDEYSADQIQEFAARLSEVRNEIVNHCEVVPSEAPDQIPDVSRELIENFSSDLLDPVFCADRGGLLLSEDMFYRQLAAQEFDVPGIWLQSVLMFALQENMIDFDDYCRKCISLAESKHGHLAVTAEILTQVAFGNDEEAGKNFDLISNVIGTVDADILSHYSVASLTIQRIWNASSLPPLFQQRLVSILIFKLIRHRKNDWQDILALLYLTMGKAFRGYLQMWVSGHFLPRLKFDKAVSELLELTFPQRSGSVRHSRRIPRE